MQSLYSVYWTNITLLLDDEFAANYNDAQDAFAKAQLVYKTTTGDNWNGEVLYIEWTDAQQKAFNQFAEFMNLYIKMNGGSLDLNTDQLSSSHLEKL